jgi:hypothetical protein
MQSTVIYTFYTVILKVEPYTRYSFCAVCLGVCRKSTTRRARIALRRGGQLCVLQCISMCINWKVLQSFPICCKAFELTIDTLFVLFRVCPDAPGGHQITIWCIRLYGDILYDYMVIAKYWGSWNVCSASPSCYAQRATQSSSVSAQFCSDAHAPWVSQSHPVSNVWGSVKSIAPLQGSYGGREKHWSTCDTFWWGDDLIICEESKVLPLPKNDSGGQD